MQNEVRERATGNAHPGNPEPPVGPVESGEFAPGTVLGGSYRLLKRLNSGGMGEIHLAAHERLPGQFVVKVLNPDMISDQDAFSRFRQEALVMANLRHPNVVQLVDFNFTLGGLPYLVMEHLPGQDLADILTNRPFLSATQISSIIRQVACALDAAHKRGIVHRDLKPENIMVIPCEGQGELIKLIDFGISKARRFNHVTAESVVIGTPDFMSPEQAQGLHDDISPASDQFALAVIAYLLLTGRTPWGTTVPVEILHRVVNHKPLPVTRDETWRSVEAVLLRGVAKAPANRYPSVLAFSRALDQAMAQDGLLPLVSTAAAPHALVSTEPVLPSYLPQESSTVRAVAGPPMHGPALVMAPTERALPEPESPINGVIVAPSALEADPGVYRDPDDQQANDGDDGRVGSDQAGGQIGSRSEADRDNDPADACPTTRLPAVRRARRGRGKLVLEAALLAAVALGTYAGLLEIPVLRDRVTGGWSRVRGMAVQAADRGLEQGHRLWDRMSVSAKTDE